jgi:hypothetical protein
MGKKIIAFSVVSLLLMLSGAMAYVVFSPPTPGSAAHFRSLSAANRNAPIPPHAVPVEQRRAAANSCEGYNLELQEGAGIQTRLGHHAEAQRLLGMRRDCSLAAEAVRSAR